MPAHIIDGKTIAAQLQQQLGLELQQHQDAGHPAPGLVVIQVGADPASTIYVQNKRLACEKVGITSLAYDLPESTSQADLLALIQQLNQTPHVNGILVQLPLPAHIDYHTILETIDALKDVDGFHPYNLGRLAQKKPLLRPCTPYGIMRLLDTTGQPLIGLNSVVVGASNIVGRPMALELLLAGCTVTICHSKTQDLEKFIKDADVLVVAIGQSGVIKSNWIKPGAIVIDVGMNRSPDGKLHGDIEFDTAKQIAGWLTPVPGGVGPMTVTTLLSNTVYAAKLQGFTMNIKGLS